MRSIIKKAAIVLSVLGGFSLFANEGTVTYLKGKAEVHRNDSWIQLKLGDSVYNSDVISTGFQSEVKIKVMDSVLSLGPVTRISLQELSSTQEKDKINIYLNTGTIRTKVNHTDNKRVSCQVRTPIGVASVRGTDFSVDDSNTISVFEGKVAVITNSAIASQNNTDTYGNIQNDFEDSEEIPDSGVLVQQNQSTQISANNTVDVPVNDVVQTITNIITKVSTSSSKESVSSAGNNSVSAIAENTQSTIEGKKKGSVVVTVSMEE